MERIIPTPRQELTRVKVRIIISSSFNRKPVYKSVIVPLGVEWSRLREFQEHCIKRFCTYAPHHLTTAKIFGKIAVAYPGKYYVLFDSLPKDIYQI